MSGNLVHINLLGTRFSIQTDETPEYIAKLTANLQERYSFIETSIGLRDPLKTAILACLFLEDELEKGDSGTPAAADGVSSEELREAEKLTLQIMENLDRELD